MSLTIGEDGAIALGGRLLEKTRTVARGWWKRSDSRHRRERSVKSVAAVVHSSRKLGAARAVAAPAAPVTALSSSRTVGGWKHAAGDV
jgi:hypothetical protein